MYRTLFLVLIILSCVLNCALALSIQTSALNGRMVVLMISHCHPQLFRCLACEVCLFILKNTLENISCVCMWAKFISSTCDSSFFMLPTLSTCYCTRGELVHNRYKYILVPVGDDGTWFIDGEWTPNKLIKKNLRFDI